jgi:hypothetical protein
MVPTSMVLLVLLLPLALLLLLCPYIACMTS